MNVMMSTEQRQEQQQTETMPPQLDHSPTILCLCISSKTCRVSMVLERNQHVELRPTIQQLFDMTQKVARDLVTVVKTVPRLGLLATARQLKELEVGLGWAVLVSVIA